MNFAPLLLAQIPDGAQAAAEPSVFNIALGVSFWTVVIFVVLAYVLAKWAFPPILGYAAAREERIQAALEEARLAREEAARYLEAQRQELASSRQRAQEMIAEARAAAERERQGMVARTRAEQEELLERARQDIASERDKAIEALRRDVIELALLAAGKVIGHRVDEAEDRRLVHEFLNGVAPERHSAGVS
jgi:F-type H+-transporting ATPase subunit b